MQHEKVGHAYQSIIIPEPKEEQRIIRRVGAVVDLPNIPIRRNNTEKDKRRRLSRNKKKPMSSDN